jgi:hypothetical protein
MEQVGGFIAPTSCTQSNWISSFRLQVSRKITFLTSLGVFTLQVSIERSLTCVRLARMVLLIRHARSILSQAEITMQDYEKLGAFYLGSSYDLEKGARQDDLTFYEAKNLTTHDDYRHLVHASKHDYAAWLCRE